MFIPNDPDIYIKDRDEIQEHTPDALVWIIVYIIMCLIAWAFVLVLMIAAGDEVALREEPSPVVIMESGP